MNVENDLVQTDTDADSANVDSNLKQPYATDASAPKKNGKAYYSKSKSKSDDDADDNTDDQGRDKDATQEVFKKEFTVQHMTNVNSQTNLHMTSADGDHFNLTMNGTNKGNFNLTDDEFRAVRVTVERVN